MVRSHRGPPLKHVQVQRPRSMSCASAESSPSERRTQCADGRAGHSDRGPRIHGRRRTADTTRIRGCVLLQPLTALRWPLTPNPENVDCAWDRIGSDGSISLAPEFELAELRASVVSLPANNRARDDAAPRAPTVRPQEQQRRGLRNRRELPPRAAMRSSFDVQPRAVRVDRARRILIDQFAFRVKPNTGAVSH